MRKHIKQKDSNEEEPDSKEARNRYLKSFYATRKRVPLSLILRAPYDALQFPKKMGLGESKYFAEGDTLVIGRAEI